MRPLIVSAYFDDHRGGIEIVAGRLARELRRGCEAVTWLASKTSQASTAPETPEQRVPVRALNWIEDVFGLPFPLPGLGALRQIRDEVVRADIVMLHDCLYPTNVAAFLVAGWLRKPRIVVQHIGNIPFRNPLLRGLMKLMTRAMTRPMLARADQVIFISSTTAEAFADVHFRHPPRLIFNGLDAGIFRPAVNEGERAAARAQLGLPLDRPVALFVGRFVEKKGLHILEQAVRLGGDVTWAFAGWGPIDPRQWGCPNVRVFSGLAEASLAPLYQASDIFVLPSTGEGFPLVLQEALACGLPAICAAEVAQADRRLAGLVHPVAVDGCDPDEVATDIVQAVRAAMIPPRPDRLADVAGWYDWSRTGELYLELMRTVSTRDADIRPVSAPSMLGQAGLDR